jgi:pyrimidine operon attenuation protein / uracil phosphoribosyltransferase
MTEAHDIPALLDGMAEELRQQLQIDDRTVMVGIHTGGVWIASELHKKLGIREPLGVLDISFYRDDFTRIGINPQVKPSHLPFSVDDRHIVLVDDVLHTGRTIRAAMNELFDYGRPASITLAVLVERDGRELPIEANVVGVSIPLGPREHVKLSGPEPLMLEVRSTA